MTRQPDVGGAGFAQRSIKPPLRTAGDRAAGREGEARGERRLHMFDGDRSGEAIADAGDRLDNLLTPFAQSPAQFRDGGCQGALDHGDARPDRIEEFFLGDRFAGAEQQLVQDLQRLGFQRRSLSVDPEGPARLVELGAGEQPQTSAPPGG